MKFLHQDGGSITNIWMRFPVLTYKEAKAVMKSSVADIVSVPCLF